MLIAIIYLLFSFIMENIMGNIFLSTLSNISFFTTIYTVCALVVLLPYFANYKKYYILVGIFGLLFDIVYTGSFFLNFFIFIVIGVVINFLYHILSENIVMTNLISIVCIGLYHILSFFILSITNYADYSIMLLLKVILHSLIMTIIYTSISYLIIKWLYNRFSIRQVK